jgi:tripeptide aminopeptidase
MVDEAGLLERFCRYVRVDTASNRHAPGIPTTESQRVFARTLATELEGMGARSVTVDDHAFVIGRFDGSGKAGTAPVVGLMAHMDTAGEVPGAGVNPQVHAGYDGRPIRLSGGLVLDPAEFPDLAGHAGDTIISSDGTTLLGADDKAGIAIIFAALEHLRANPQLPRCPLEVIFTPDEETGLAMSSFPLNLLSSAVCYTVDGGEEGVIEAECFEAYKALIELGGRSIHPGTARGRLVNAVEMAGTLISLLPRSESPESTDGRYGFYCPLEVTGDIEKARVELFVRDFEERECLRRLQAVEAMAAMVRAAFPGGTVSVKAEKQYSNMRRRIEAHPFVLESLRRAITAAGLAPRERPIRGGTDGARLTEMGIPTPNIFTGGRNYHSRLEWVSLSGMVKAAQTIVHLAGLWAAEGAAAADPDRPGAGTAGAGGGKG